MNDVSNMEDTSPRLVTCKECIGKLGKRRMDEESTGWEIASATVRMVAAGMVVARQCPLPQVATKWPRHG